MEAKKQPNYSYDDLAVITGKTKSQLIQLAHTLQIEKLYKRGSVVIPFSAAQQLINYKPSLKRPKENHRRKISIIEAYMSNESIKAVSRTLKINAESVRKAVEEWEDTGYITVDSYINFAPKNNYTGIYKRGKVWGYDCKINKIRYQKAGFETEEQAFSELCKLKESL